MPSLYWLPECADFRDRLRALKGSEHPWDDAVKLAHFNLDFVKTNNLDAAIEAVLKAHAHSKPGKPVRLAILSSSTTTHLHAGLRVAGLRRNMPVEIYENNYGQYWQELADETSALHTFKPNHVLFALDAFHLTQGFDAAMTEAEADAAITDLTGRITGYWRLAREAFQCPILQQTIVPAHLALLGGNEHNLPGSKNRVVSVLNEALRKLAADNGVHLVAIDSQIARDGLNAWFDPALWHRSKQEITPTAGPMYGDLVLRIVAALGGRAAKCLVLDLDNTVWGGVVGDDGVEGIVLGQGSAEGEAFVSFQEYALELSRRGVMV
jgi:predicted enzyme involved in methoxymalonyl-ACP biosynthesis